MSTNVNGRLGSEAAGFPIANVTFLPPVLQDLDSEARIIAHTRQPRNVELQHGNIKKPAVSLVPFSPEVRNGH